MDKSKKRQYRDLLTQKERDAADKRLDELKKSIPKTEEKLHNKHGRKNNLYRYELGKELSQFIDKHSVSTKERYYYWEDLRDYASRTDFKTKDRSSKRQDYEYCFLLSQLHRDTVLKLSWRQWQDILDRKNIREDKRIFNWIKHIDFKMKEQTWRDFTKALNLYFKNVDTTVYEDEEMLSDFNNVYFMVIEWETLVRRHFGIVKNMSSARRKNLTKYKKKYYEEIIYVLRMKEVKDISFECDEVFKKVYVVQDGT